MSFFLEFVRNPFRTGAVAPSSRFLVEKMLAPIDFSRATTIVELGSGTGVFTAELLKRMRPDATLYSLELNTFFVTALRERGDPRLVVLQEDARDLEKVVKKYGLSVDYIVSGLPLGSMPRKHAQEVLGTVEKVLDKGTFIQFQYTPRWHRLFKEFFSVSLAFTPWNLPPALVYVCSQK